MQTDRDRGINGQVDRDMKGHTDGQTNRWIDKLTDRDRGIHGQVDRDR